MTVLKKEILWGFKSHLPCQVISFIKVYAISCCMNCYKNHDSHWYGVLNYAL